LVEALLEGGSIGITADANRPSSPKAAEVAPAAATPVTDAASSGSEEESSADSDSPEQRVSRSDDPASKASSAGEHLACLVGAPLTQFADGTPWQAGLSAGMHWRATPALYAGARYTFFGALTLSTADVAASVKRHPLEIVFGYREAGRLGLNAEAGIIADRVTRTTLRTAEAFQATSSDARWQLALGARGGVSWSPWSPLWATMRVGADIILTPYSYVVDSNHVVPSPRGLRPRVELELAVWVW